MTEKSLGQILYEANVSEQTVPQSTWESLPQYLQRRCERVALAFASEVRRRSAPPPMSLLEVRCLLQKIRNEAEISPTTLTYLSALQECVEKEQLGVEP